MASTGRKRIRRSTSASVLSGLIAILTLAATYFAPPSNTAQLLFVGDYATGNFLQWRTIVTTLYNRAPGYVLPTADYVPGYPAAVIDDPIKGKAARYEIRNGDFVTDFPNVQISEVTTTVPDTGGAQGETTWYSFSTRFDSTFPKNHADLGWGLTNEWHEGSNQGGNPPISMMVGLRNGYWSLALQPQSEAGVRSGPTYSIWDVPLGTDWHDLKLQVHWSTTDGWIRLWHNGIRQKLLGGVDTFWTPTLVPGTSSVYYMEGYYRRLIALTGVVYHQGFRVATDEAALQ